MSRPINAVIFGVGAMGKLTTRYLVEKGVKISGAYNRTSNLGEDLGTVAGLKQPLNVPITSAREATPKALLPMHWIKQNNVLPS